MAKFRRPASRLTLMFLSVKEMELRKIRFDESFEPARIEFASENLEQASALHAVGSAELLKNARGQVRIQGRYSVDVTAPCDRCLATEGQPRREFLPLMAY